MIAAQLPIHITQETTFVQVTSLIGAITALVAAVGSVVASIVSKGNRVKAEDVKQKIEGA